MDALKEKLANDTERYVELLAAEREKAQDYSFIAQVLVGIILAAGENAPNIKKLRQRVEDVFKLLERDPAKYKDMLRGITRGGSSIATSLEFEDPEEAPQVDSNTEAIIFIRHKPEAKA
jgi:hypothetical protein